MLCTPSIDILFGQSPIYALPTPRDTPDRPPVPTISPKYSPIAELAYPASIAVSLSGYDVATTENFLSKHLTYLLTVRYSVFMGERENKLTRQTEKTKSQTREEKVMATNKGLVLILEDKLETIATENDYNALCSLASNLKKDYEFPYKVVGVKKETLRKQVGECIIAKINELQATEIIEETENTDTTDETEETVEDTETVEETAPIEETVEETDSTDETEIEETTPSDLTDTVTDNVTVTADLALRIDRIDDMVKMIDYTGAVKFSIPVEAYNALCPRVKQISFSKFIEINSPVIIPEVSEWLSSHGHDPYLTDTGRCNGESRLFESVDSYIAINRNGSVNGQAIPKAALEMLGITIEQRSKAIEWSAWLGIGKKKPASAGIGGSGGKVKHGNYVGADKSKRGIQGEKQDRFVLWMMDGYHTLPEIQAYLEVAENTARDHLSYIRYWGCELEKVNRDGVKVYRITADKRPARG